jgi:hypothetical protein
MGIRFCNSFSITFSLAMALSRRAVCAGVGGVSAMMCGFFAWAAKVKIQTCSMAKEILRKIAEPRFVIIASHRSVDSLAVSRELKKYVNVSDVVCGLSVFHRE